MLIAALDTYKGAKYPLTMPENTDTLANLEMDFCVYEKIFFENLLGAKEGEALYNQLIEGGSVFTQYTPLISGIVYLSESGVYRKTTPIVELMKSYCFVNYLLDNNYTIAFDGSVVQLNTTGLLNNSNIQKDVKGFEVAKRWNGMCGEIAFVYDYISLNYSNYKDVNFSIWPKKSLI